MLFALPLLLGAASVPPSTTIPRHAGQCSWVRGRLSIYNGSSLNRLWVVGTDHLLALRDDDQDVPPAVWRLWHKSNPFDYELWGDFRVCARERWIKGHMQHIRICAARRTVLIAP